MICNFPCRIVLIVMNTASMLVGLALLIVGALMVWGQQVIKSMLSSFITPLMQKFFSGHDATSITELVTRILTSTSPVGMALFIIGAVFMGISAFGYCGACCDMKLLLYIYVILVSVLALAVLVAFSVYFGYREKIAATVLEYYNTSVHEYVSMEKNDLASLVVGLISPQLNCCGYNNGNDFKNANMSTTDQYDGRSYTGLAFPIVCCKMNNLYVIMDTTCPATFTDANSNINTGCALPLKEAFIKYMNYAAYGLVAAFVVLLLVILFGVLTACI